MTDGTPIRLEFARCQRRRVEAAFSGGEITSDGGVLLLSQLDRQLGLTAALDRVLGDPRCPGRVELGYSGAACCRAQHRAPILHPGRRFELARDAELGGRTFPAQ